MAKSARKKKQVSKHILESNNYSTSKSSASQNKKKANCHVKHPDEASSYLTQWKKSKSGSSSCWKFNKNTQSWLIRHMYDVDKVAKSSFVLLLDYLEGLESKPTRDRIRAEASRRVRRHKEYCNATPKTVNEKSTNNNSQSVMDKEGDNNNNSDNDSSEKRKPTAMETMGEAEVEDDEEAQWRKLDDHNKRKQYKRARRILNLMK